jgi:hypothetical protein
MAVQCPRCGSGVSETAEKCPICSAPMGEVVEAAPAPTVGSTTAGHLPGLPTPVQEQATPNYLNPGSAAAPASGGGMGGGDVRVSLTGEVMEVAPPSPRGSGPGGYGPPPTAGPPRPGGAPAGPPTRQRYGAAREIPEETNNSAKIIRIVCLVLLLAGGAFGGWYWYNNRTNPKEQAVTFYQATFKDHDWKKSFAVCAFDAEDKKKFPDADAYAKYNEEQMQKPLIKAVFDQIGQISDFKADEPTITGNTATVPTSSKISIAGRDIALKGSVKMIKEGGQWKVDFTGNDNEDNMVLYGIFGKPEGGVGGMGGAAGQ